MTRFCYYDCETYSEVPINQGTHRYAEQAEIMVHAYAFDDGPVHVYDATQIDALMPADLLEAFEDRDVIFVIHNSSFDRTLLHYAEGIDLPTHRIFDTLVCARTIGLPGGLGQLCEIMKVPTDKAKDKRGKQLINIFCKPRPKTSTIRRATYATHPVEWDQFLEYARFDVEAMRELHRRLPGWNYSGREFALWQLDQQINDRGCEIDTALVYAAIEAVSKTSAEINANTCDATFGLVGSATQRDQLLRYILRVYGVELPDMQADTLERRLNDPELPQGVRDLIAMRLMICTSSTAKYKTLEKRVSSDGRLRGSMEFCGAARTGRWAGRGFQPQNLPSRGLLPARQIEIGIGMLKLGCAELVFDNIMHLTSSCIRGCIVAPKGKKLYISDLSNIEGRKAAWLAGEGWKLQAFRDLDAGTGADLYRLAYARTFNIDVDDVDEGKEKGPQRQIGKVMELFLQYEGGVGAFITGAVTYGIDLDKMADAAYLSIHGRIMDEARNAWRWAIKRNATFGLSEKTYCVCDSLKRMWREAHPQISSYWGELRTKTILAITNPSKDFVARKIKIRRDGNWLRIILPSGRSLCYAAPRVEDDKISYMGVSQYTRKWQRIGTYGGKLFENITQAAARDIMAWNMPAIDDAGYEITLSVHDELITEAPDTDEYTAVGLSAMLAANPSWAPDLPLAAGGFESYRYRKD